MLRIHSCKVQTFLFATRGFWLTIWETEMLERVPNDLCVSEGDVSQMPLFLELARFVLSRSNADCVCRR